MATEEKTARISLYVTPACRAQLDHLWRVGRTAASRLGCFSGCLLGRGTPAEPNVRISRIRLPDYLAIVRRGRSVAPGSQNQGWLKYQLLVW